jgi:predicted dehydrogenase
MSHLFTKLGAAVVGTGFIGPVHVEALRRLGVPVRGIAASSWAKAQHATSELGLETAYPDYESLLADDRVRVVHLTTPNRFHAEQVAAALRAGKHVVCEKPLAMTSQETRVLCELAAEHPHQVCAVNYNLRFYPLILEAKALMEAGQLGPVLHVRGGYVQDWLLYNTDFNWRVLASEGGVVRAVGDIGTHWLDCIRFITGLEVVEVCADLGIVHAERFRPHIGSSETFTAQGLDTQTLDTKAMQAVPIDTEDYGHVLLRFDNGAKGVFTVSQVTAGRKNRLDFEIAGGDCAMAWDSEHHETLWLGERSRGNRLLMRDSGLMSDLASAYTSYPGGHAEGFPDTFKQLYRAIYHDIAAHEAGTAPASNPLYASFADGHKELALCEAIFASHRAGGWVRVQC